MNLLLPCWYIWVHDYFVLSFFMHSAHGRSSATQRSCLFFSCFSLAVPLHKPHPIPADHIVHSPPPRTSSLVCPPSPCLTGFGFVLCRLIYRTAVLLLISLPLTTRSGIAGSSVLIREIGTLTPLGALSGNTDMKVKCQPDNRLAVGVLNVTRAIAGLTRFRSSHGMCSVQLPLAPHDS